MYAFEINNRIKAGLQLSGYFKRNYIWKATGPGANKASQWERVRKEDDRCVAERNRILTKEVPVFRLKTLEELLG